MTCQHLPGHVSKNVTFRQPPVFSWRNPAVHCSTVRDCHTVQCSVQCDCNQRVDCQCAAAMLATYKAQVKSRGSATPTLRARTASVRSSSKSPKNVAEASGAAQQGSRKLDKMDALLAQPIWATQLQRMIANVSEPEQQEQLRCAMLEFSMQNADHTSNFLRPQDCRYVPDAILCSIGRYVEKRRVTRVMSETQAMRRILALVISICRFHGAFTGSVKRTSGWSDLYSVRN